MSLLGDVLSGGLAGCPILGEGSRVGTNTGLGAGSFLGHFTADRCGSCLRIATAALTSCSIRGLAITAVGYFAIAVSNGKCCRSLCEIVILVTERNRRYIVFTILGGLLAIHR